MTELLAVPNVSEGRDARTIAAIGEAFSRGGARVLDVHSDPDHHRSVFTLVAPAGVLAHALTEGARTAIDRIDLHEHDGVHPHVGALDVAPVVFLEPDRRGAAAAEALVLGEELGALGLPVLLYGALAGGRTRAELRRGGPQELARRLQAGELEPDFGPLRAHPSAGATLVAVRPPLVAFNLELAPPATLEDARTIAASVRATLEGVTALGLYLRDQGVVQVSTNVEDHRATPLATVLHAVREHATVRRAELVGLAPEEAFAGWPDAVEIRNRRSIEVALAG